MHAIQMSMRMTRFPYFKKGHHGAYSQVKANLEDIFLGTLEILQLPLIDRPIKAGSCQQSIVQRPEEAFHPTVVAPDTVAADSFGTEVLTRSLH